MFTLRFDTDNEVFHKYPDIEISRILKDVAAQVKRGIQNGTIMDENGNSVGAWAWE
jgi:hypothetical protein